jgi:hypothetical protein
VSGVRVIAAAVLAAGLVVAGCGDDDDETEAALSETEYLAQANEICKTGEREIEQAAEESFKGRASEAEVEEFAAETIVPSIQGQIDDIRALTPPADQADEFEAFVDDAQAALDELEADPSLITQGASADPFAEVNAEAEQLGLDRCAG